MFLVKSVYFFVAIFAVVYAEFELNDFDRKRSAVCLVQRVAQYNNVFVNYTIASFEYINATTHAKERVAQQAYAKTNYTKPPIHNRTCVVETPTAKSDINLLEDYAKAIGFPVTYEEKLQTSKCTFGYEISLNGRRASGTSDKKKKEAKKLATANLIKQIGRPKIIDTLISKYNRTQFHSMDPMKRLRKIVQVYDLTGDGVYKKVGEVPETKAGKTVKRIVMQVEAKDLVTTGHGNNVHEAKTNAAVNLLRHLRFVVDYPPKAEI